MKKKQVWDGCMFKGRRQECPYCYGNDPCSTQTHHRYWPRRTYNTTIERQFRNLHINKATLCGGFHKDYHETHQPPPKPSVGFMRRAIDREKREQP